MTEKREKYMASISNEELVIREEIYYHNDLIKSLKDIFCDDGVIKNSWKFAIAREKTIIKSLKKQLPAPVRFIRDGEWAYNSCSVCKDAINEDELYCHNCGQKLR